MTEDIYSISDVAAMVGVHPQTLRNWERAGLITPQRMAGNRRVYFDEDVELLQRIVQMEREEGLRVTDIRRVLELEAKLGGR
jgi:MerR family transcriptional regulator/heat shock protein HspR